MPSEGRADLGHHLLYRVAVLRRPGHDPCHLAVEIRALVGRRDSGIDDRATGARCRCCCQVTDEHELAHLAGWHRELALTIPALSGLRMDALGTCPLTEVHHCMV